MQAPRLVYMFHTAYAVATTSYYNMANDVGVLLKNNVICIKGSPMIRKLMYRYMFSVMLHSDA